MWLEHRNQLIQKMGPDFTESLGKSLRMKSHEHDTTDKE